MVRVLGSSGKLALRAVQDLKSVTNRSSQELRGASRRVPLQNKSEDQNRQVSKTGATGLGGLKQLPG